MIVVLDADTLDFDESVWKPFEAFGPVHSYGSTPSDDAIIAERIQGAKIVFTNKVPLGQTVIECSPDLQFIGVLATGYNIIDLDAANRAGIAVCNVPAYSGSSVAQHTLALILELCHQVGLHNRSVQSGDWVRSPLFTYWKSPLIELKGRTVGFLGFGDIARRVAELCHLMGASIIAHTPSRRNAPNWERFFWVDQERLFADSDILSLHCPQTPKTTKIISDETLALMKPTAFLINTARGGLIDEAKLAKALREGTIAGAALDVVSVEPMQADNPLLGAPHCIITPHLAWSSLESRQRLMEISLENLQSWQAGNRLNRVD